ncbi:MAG: MoxR family ATPase [Spirochaetaceae bacterium]|jgi:MoxR-like ATPase|nr:MoxR family ATPase [Spirochaetaceae bacterium]
MQDQKDSANILKQCRYELQKRIVGQSEMLDELVSSLVSGGHVLLEGPPGLAKTRSAIALAELSGLSFKRIQFTPDLLPADLTGTMVWEQGKNTFAVHKGPLFANIILADEVNRAPAKVQSALLEAMEEKQVSIGGESYPLPSPFIVLATQNPIEQEGTYSLPEAELDRFFIKLKIPYPKLEEEIDIIKTQSDKTANNQPLEPLLQGKTLAGLQAAWQAVQVDDKLAEYIANLVLATRPENKNMNSTSTGLAKNSFYRYIKLGASPRASLCLHIFARVKALFDNRNFVIPDDIKAAAHPVLRHRIIRSWEAEAEGADADSLIDILLNHVPLP